MFNKTTLTALRALQQLALRDDSRPVSPRQLAFDLTESPSYLAKITRDLAKAGIVRSENGSKGGVYLARAAESITLQEIVEACEGVISGRFCQSDVNDNICSFHEAALELHEATVSVLRHWTLADLMARREVDRPIGPPCVMFGSRDVLAGKL